MSTIDHSDVRQSIAGVGTAEIARRYGTPCYVYDAAQICQRVADPSAFDVVRYAQKACSSLAIVDLSRRQGAMVDAVSAGEIRRALAAGYSPTASDGPPPIVFIAATTGRKHCGVRATGTAQRRSRPELPKCSVKAQPWGRAGTLARH